MSAARIAGAVVAAVSLALLVWVAVLTFGPAELVTPETRIVPATDAGGTGQTSAMDLLRQRNEQQMWRGERQTDDSPDARDVGQPPRMVLDESAGVDDPRGITETWLGQRDQFADILPEGGRIEGLTTVPYAQMNTFVQPEGRQWRRTHNDDVRYGGGWILFGIVLVLALFLAAHGRIPLVHGFSGRTIERFNTLERANHWMTASSFIVMGITGLIILYGKPLLLPLIGEAAFGDVAWWSAWLHMALAIPFVLGVAVMIALWLVDNLPDRYDWPWIRQFGGFMRDSAEHPPAGRFNAGQKLVFWSVVVGGLALAATGVAMMFPFYWLGYDGMQWMQLAHAGIALLMVALIFGHVYIGTIGMEGAFDAMWSGHVDRNWLKEHHSVWYREIESGTASAADADQHAPGQQPAE